MERKGGSEEEIAAGTTGGSYGV